MVKIFIFFVIAIAIIFVASMIILAIGNSFARFALWVRKEQIHFTQNKKGVL